MKIHWLPVKQRVRFSILLLVFRAQHRLAPPYITDLLEQRATRVLRPTTNNEFSVPPSRSRYGNNIFSVAGPLPAEMKKTSCLITFKRHLSVYLICICLPFITLYTFYINFNFAKCYTHYFIIKIPFILIIVFS